ncbi:hypothetical protein EES43_17730 [Streptomyces sp. ADI96-02]|uniref:hypothetical protein n=1 Tax=unclassified Streptomyces TaxID=2593676 RepID=UPI000F54F2F6|nr:hypothetical protein [Streptomyces sp. ADI96-02]RPK59990.1 hypothetical protein EES43_17730 [Streptomyces sp. ADI96-02]
MIRPALSDPLGTALAWVWAFGTAAGLAMIGTLAQGEYSADQDFLAHSSLNVDDQGPNDTAG